MATSAGVFRSLDGGKSWGGLNQGLPNLPAVRIWDLPSGERGTQLEIPGANIVEWQPGEKQAWRPVNNSDALRDESLRRATGSTAIQIAESSISGNAVYQGTADGSLSVKLGGNDPVPSRASNGGRCGAVLGGFHGSTNRPGGDWARGLRMPFRAPPPSMCSIPWMARIGTT